MQKYIAIGRLTKDNELKYTQNKKEVLKNGVAIKRDKENTDFINFTTFGNTAKFMSEYTNKGDLIYLEGELRTGSYEKDGNKVYTQDILVSKVQLLSRKEKLQETPKNDVKKEETINDPYEDFANEVEISNDELPF